MNKTPSNSRLIICGTARNVEVKIERVISDITRSFSSFQEIQILICESFSTDKTVDRLLSLRRSTKNFDFIQDKKIDKFEERRTVRISSARTALQERVQLMYGDYDYVVMLDLDGVNRDLTTKSVESIWKYENWDAAFANQPLRYYDIWALRAKGWSEGDCWKEYQELLQILPKSEAKRNAVTSKMRSIPRNAQPIPVESAFGGLAIYRTETFLDGEYLGVDGEGNEVCEHVYFHKILSEKGHKLFIMPNLVNLNRRTQVLNIIKEFLLRVSRRIK